MTAPAFCRGVAVAAVVVLAACARTQPTGPEIASVAPDRATVGATVTLTGSRFGAEAGASTVTLDGVAATVTSWSDTSITFTVPDVLPGARPISLTVGGDAAGASLTVALQRRLYACDDASPDNSVSVYTIAADGQLAPLSGSPFATGGEGPGYGGMSNCIRVHVPSRRLYAVNTASVSIFSIDPITGALTQLPGSPTAIASGRNPGFYSLEISPDGNTVFLPDDANTEMIVASVAADGSLTEIAGSPFTTQGEGSSVAEVRPDGAFLYLQPEAPYVDLFAVATGGGLTRVDDYPYSESDDGWTIRINAAGTKLAIGRDGVAVMTLDPTTGIPTLAADVPLEGPDAIGALAWHPNGNFLYAVDWSSGELFGWTVAADGSGTPIAGSPWANAVSGGSVNTGGLEITSDGAFLFVGYEDGEGIASYSLDANGVPTRVGTTLAPHVGGLSFLVSTL